YNSFVEDHLLEKAEQSNDVSNVSFIELDEDNYQKAKFHDSEPEQEEQEEQEDNEPSFRCNDKKKIKSEWVHIPLNKIEQVTAASRKKKQLAFSKRQRKEREEEEEIPDEFLPKFLA